MMKTTSAQMNGVKYTKKDASWEEARIFKRSITSCPTSRWASDKRKRTYEKSEKSRTYEKNTELSTAQSLFAAHKHSH